MFSLMLPILPRPPPWPGYRIDSFYSEEGAIAAVQALCDHIHAAYPQYLFRKTIELGYHTWWCRNEAGIYCGVLWLTLGGDGEERKTTEGSDFERIVQGTLKRMREDGSLDNAYRAGEEEAAEREKQKKKAKKQSRKIQAILDGKVVGEQDRARKKKERKDRETEEREARDEEEERNGGSGAEMSDDE